MAQCEMEEIQEMDWDFMDCHIDKMIFYYGENDGWCPRSHYESMASRYPDLLSDGRIHLCRNQVKHAFVLDDGEARFMARFLVEQWLNNFE